MTAIAPPMLTDRYADPASSPGTLALQASTTRLSAGSQSNQVDISLTTTEGDTVTLSLSSRLEYLDLHYAQWGRTESGAFENNGSLEFEMAQRSLDLSVEGDLNADELKEIKQVLKKVDRMMRHLIAGRLKPAAAQMAQSGRFDTLAQVDVRMSASTTRLTIEQSQSHAAYTREGLPTEAAPVEETGDPLQSVMAEADQVSRLILREIASARVSSDRLHKALHEQFAAYGEQEGPESPIKDMLNAVLDRVRLQTRIAAPHQP